MIKVTERWYVFAHKNFRSLNIILLAVTVLMCVSLRNIKFNADWLELFSLKDSLILDYQQLIGNEGVNSIYLKIYNTDTKVIESLAFLDRKNSVKSRQIISQNDRDIWLKIVLRELGSQPEKLQALNAIKQKLLELGVDYRITGPLEIIDQFNHSVQTDFYATSLVVFTVIVLLIIYFYGFNFVVFYGFLLQICGMVAGFFAYSVFYDEVNIITATIPGILLGLGIDFTIHIATAAMSIKTREKSAQVVYSRVTRPMFWGMLTTAFAFTTLCFNSLSGLMPAALLATFSLIAMYFTVSGFMPIFAEKTSIPPRFGIQHMKLPGFAIHQQRWFPVALSLIVVIFAVIMLPKLEFEEKAENLYNPDLPALKTQQLLSNDIGFNPAVLFLKFSEPIPSQKLVPLKGAKNFQILPDSLITAKTQTIKVVSKGNPFDRDEMRKLRNEASTLLSIQPAQLEIIGAPQICQHLNDLLFAGMTSASLTVFIVIFILIIFIFRQIKPALIVAFILFLATISTMAFFSLLRIKLSTYTLILFPMLLGIGIDDCLHLVFHLKKNDHKVKSGDQVVKAVTLTTITTIVGYGSLMFSSNRGMFAMGAGATVGLICYFIFAIYLLPCLFIARKQKNTITKMKRSHKS